MTITNLYLKLIHFSFVSKFLLNLSKLISKQHEKACIFNGLLHYHFYN